MIELDRLHLLVRVLSERSREAVGLSLEQDALLCCLDLAGSEAIAAAHMAEALQYRARGLG